MADIHFNCSKCGQTLEVDESGVGMQVNCPKCNQSITVPPASSPAKPVVRLVPQPPSSGTIPMQFNTENHRQTDSRTCGVAIASMILGILSLLSCGITGIPAVICGHIARSKIRKSAGALGGSGMALAGLITGYFGTVLTFVAVIGLLAGLAVPGFTRSRMRSQGERTVNDCRIMDHAIDEWAIETGQKNGNPIDMKAAANFLKGTWPTTDALGNAYSFTVVGPTQVQINAATKEALSGVGIDWANY